MSHNIYISINGPDQLGLVAAVSACLFDLGGNLRDTSFAVLGTGFEYSCVVDVPDELDAGTVETELAALEQLEAAQLTVSEFRYQIDQGDSSPITHWIEVIGSDRPGLIARISEVFGEFNANLVRMSSGRERTAGHESGGDAGVPRYVTRFEVSIPPERAGACLAAVDNTAGQLQLTCNWGSVRR
ncbi:MAG: ACT domain-containing protein [Rhodospirillales bacterium]|nr:ACT domain-containing protein [Rhodospirillales bacterium]